MARILILSSTHLCQNPRALKEASTLGGAGHEVTLLSVSLRADFEATDRMLMAGRPFHRIVVDLSRDNAAGVLHRIQRRLARTLTARIGLQSIHSLGPGRALLRRARALPFDLLIAHTEAPLWVARQLAHEGRRVAADIEDWYSEDLLPEDRRTRPLRLLQSLERFALREGAYVSVPSHSMAEALHRIHGGRRPVVIRNSFPLQPDPRPLRPPSSPPRFVWFSQTVGPGRGLEEFLSVLTKLDDHAELHLIGQVRASYRQQLLARVPASFASSIFFHDAVPPDDLPGVLAGYDIGLALEASTPPNRDTTIPNKILQYLNAGLAVLATPTAGQREVLSAAPRAGLLINLAAPDECAFHVSSLLANGSRVTAMQHAARTAAESTFCWEREAPTLVSTVESALTK